ncbi:hypothetical protein HDU76_006725, partial [Blyttiomyces sp. JEL0837]
MHFSALVLAAALLLAANANAAAVSKQPITVRISRRHSDLGKTQRVLKNAKSVASRFGPGNNGEGPQRRATSAPLTNLNDLLYSAPVTIGNGQAFALDLDTGSSDLWVRGPSCSSTDGSCTGTKACIIVTLKTTDSTIKDKGTTFSVSYGSGSASGEVYTGPVSLAGATATIPFGATTKETGFGGAAFDGLLGLGYSALNSISGGNWFDALGFTGTQNVFGFYLSNSKDGDTGEFTVGGYDSSKLTGAITYIPLNAKTYWQFSWSGATYSIGSSSGSAAGTVTNAIADTGTTLIILDTTPAANINKAIGAGAYDSTQGVYPIACSVATTGPIVKLTFGGATFSIPPSVYVFNDAGTCFSGFTKGAGSGVPVILGDIFLRNYYSIYDKAQNRVGFAQALHPGTTPVTSTTSTTAAPTTTTTKASTTTTSAAPTTTGTTCAHSICVTGTKLTSTCDPCAQKIIAADSYCGSTSWDSICVGEVKS